MASSLPMSDPAKKPTVIGLYGVSGCGKSFLLASLKESLDHEAFEFFEGSEVISKVVPGGLEIFQQLAEPTKATERSKAILHVQEKCQQSGRAGVVAGHYMFWPEDQAKGEDVHTADDLQVFTHILYLAVDPKRIAQYRAADTLKDRPDVSPEHLCRWQQAEISGLQDLCRHHHILFTVQRHPFDTQRLCNLVQHFREDTEEENWRRVTQQIDGYLLENVRVRTMLVLDADKTLAEEDSGILFWQMLGQSRTGCRAENPLGELFGGPLGYSDCAFRQAALLYEESVTDAEFEALCESVASHIVMHHQIITFMRPMAHNDRVGLIIVTCGLRRVWEKVLEREGLLNAVSVVGGGRTSDAMVVTGELKAAIVGRLRKHLGLHVWAFGDSPLDIPMLVEADEAVVVVGKEQTRSRSMDAAVLQKIRQGVLRPRQILLPEDVTLRLDSTLMPRVRLEDPEFIQSIILDSRREDKSPGTDVLPTGGLVVFHATEKPAAKLLMSPTRNASIAGPALRAAHFAMGKYLATEYVSKEIGLEEYLVPHVQGHQTHGYRLQGEAQTTIVALMRGGEAMALGVNEVFPRAMFVHAGSPSDLKEHHLRNQEHLILVDSVVNSGKTIREFVGHIQQLHWKAPVLVVAGVVQAGAVSKLEDLAGQLSIIALRISDNKFVGTKTTDTGNRLYNTTHLD